MTPPRELNAIAEPAVLGGRAVPRVYRVVKRSDIHAFLINAVVQSGARVLYASGAEHVPVFMGIQEASGERRGLMIYPFRVTRQSIKNRPTDEIRGQLRFGSEESWRSDDHYVARDVAGVDVTLLLGIYLDGNMIMGLDPSLYDPLPLGISVYAKDAQLKAVADRSWTVWERENHAGSRRNAPRSAEGLETLVAFRPNRLLDYARFEGDASLLGLDPPLRFSAATDAGAGNSPRQGLKDKTHNLESSFDLSAHAILDIIATRMRLEVAVKGGVAEYHLEQILLRTDGITSVQRLDQDSQPDFSVKLASGSSVLVECKNVSPEAYANGDFKVEVQKTRATRDDPAGRLYRPDQFDVVAACLYSPTRRWEFRYILTSRLERHAKHPERLAATHRVDGRWALSLGEALESATESLVT